MDFSVPEDFVELLSQLDDFIEDKIVPLQREHEQYFDHRREYARTDWENGGIPRQEWEALLQRVRRMADEAGFLRYALPHELGGSNGSNLGMAIIREHLAHRGLGLHNVLQQEASIVGNFPIELILHRWGSEQQKQFIEPCIRGDQHLAFGITEPHHGSDATWMETRAVRDGDAWVINGRKRFNSAVHHATHDVVLARTSGEPGDPDGITAFIVPMETAGLNVLYYHWTFNMPTDHAEVELDDVRVGDDTILFEEGQGLRLIQAFVHENRIRQAAAGVGMAQYCIDEAVAYARERQTFGRALASRQAIQWPLAELHTEAEMVRNVVYKTAWSLDQVDDTEVRDMVSMANYRANRLVCDAADQAMQVHGGMGYTRHKPFEHIYRHHRRYRITEGTEEMQIRTVAGHLFSFL